MKPILNELNNQRIPYIAPKMDIIELEVESDVTVITGSDGGGLNPDDQEDPGMRNESHWKCYFDYSE